MTTLVTPKSQMPAVDLPLVGGGWFELSEAKPDNFQIVVAYRGVHCPKCKAQLEDIATRLDDIRDAGHDIIAISMDSEERANKAADEWDTGNLPIAYGMELLTARQLGLFISDAISEAEPRKFNEPGIFVVRNDGSLYAQIIQNTPFGRPDMANLVKGLNYAVENDYPVRGVSTF